MAVENNKYVRYLNKSVKIVDKPNPAENVSVYVRPGDLVDFRIPGVNLEDLEYELVGGDIVIDIPNYGKFTFVSMALMGFNDSPPSFLSTSGKRMNLGDILSEVEEINALPIDSLVSNIDVNIPDNTAKENEEGDSTQNNPQSAPVVIIQEVEVAPDENPQVDEAPAEFEIPPVEVPEIIENKFTSNDDGDDTSSKKSTTEGTTPSLTFDINIQHVVESSSNESGTLVVQGGGGISYGNVYPNSPTDLSESLKSEIVKQTDAEVIDYSTTNSLQYNNVVINADDASLFSDTQNSRTIIINSKQPEGYAVEEITISSTELLSGFYIENAQRVGDSWVITKDNPDTDAIDGFQTDSNGRIELVATADIPSENLNFTLDINLKAEFDLLNIEEEKRVDFEVPQETTLEASNQYGLNLKAVSTPGTYGSDYQYETVGGNDTGFVITTNINDTVIKGSTTLENTINGGVARDEVTTGVADDTIITNSGDDYIAAGLGDDIIDAGEGVDTIDFSNLVEVDGVSNPLTGIEVNLDTGNASGHGNDTISGVENVIGTEYRDTIIGNDLANKLEGGRGSDTILAGAANDTLLGEAGDDTLQGGTGDDYLDGGEGNNTVSFEDLSNSVIVDLKADVDDPTRGSAIGVDGEDQLYNFDNVIGSNSDDIITGNDSKNIINSLDGNDTIFGNLGNDTIDGGEGTDTIDFSNATTPQLVDLANNTANGEEGRDALFNIENVVGSQSDDTLIGDDKVNELKGNSGDDILRGGLNDDTLFGGLDDDTLFGGLGDDTINGEGGIDTANYSDIVNSDSLDPTKGVTVSLAIDSSQDTGIAGSDTLTEIENLVGTIFNDTLTGNISNNSLLGESGNDTIITGGSNNGFDYVDGGAGEDLLSYKDETQSVFIDLEDTEVQDTGVGRVEVRNIENVEGGEGSDRISGSNILDNTLYGNSGNDILNGRSGNDFLYGGNDDDSLYGEEGNDYLEAGEGDDLLEAGEGDDTLYGNEGDDSLIGNAGDDYIDGGTGTDTIDYTTSLNGVNLTLGETGVVATANIGTETDQVVDVENIIGSDNNDVLGGNSLNNTIISNAGNDTLKASDGLDRLEGGTGSDTVDYSQRNNSIDVTLNGDNLATLKENDTDKDSLFSIENVTGSTANDTITGDDNINVLNGNAGNDTLIGGLGADIIDGGIGVDTVSYSYVTGLAGVDVNLKNEIGTNKNDNNDIDTLQNLENVIGTNRSDTIIGNSSDNMLEGSTGDDFLSGEEGNDILDGGIGNDTLKGGAGNDNFLGGDGIDTVDYSDETEDITVDLKSLSSVEISASQGIDTFDSIEGVIGGSGDDILIGTTGANNLDGNSGNDTLVSFGGNDTLDGGTGNDLVSFGFTSSNISLDLSNSNAQTSGVGELVVTNVENITGGLGNDILTGDDENNSLNGGFGADTLIGNGGNDTLDGGRDSDARRITIDNTNSAFTIAFITAGISITASANSDLAVMLDDVVNQFNTSNSDLSLGSLAHNGTELLLETTDTINVVNGTASSASFIDVVDYSSFSTDSIDVDLNKTTEQVDITDGSKDTLVNIEKIIASNQDDRLIGDSNDNIFEGRDGDDIMSGGAGSDTMSGGKGNDTFISSLNDGIDTIDGGDDSDTVDYSVESDSIVVSLDGSNQTRVQINGIDNDYIENIENIESGSGNDILTGDSNDNTFISNAGDDTLSGGAGNDYLDAGTGGETAGDTVDYSYIVGSTGANVDLSNNSASDIGSGTEVGTDSLFNIENVKGSKNDDILEGNSLNNTLEGALGADSLVGNDGNDILLGQEGNDILKGGFGNDTLNGGDGIDTADFSDANAGVNINLSATGPVLIGAGLGTDTFIDIEGAIGGAYNDEIRGTDDANSLVGNAGNDTLQGGGTSGAEAGQYDYIDGGAGVDFVSYSYLVDPTEKVTINLGLDYNDNDNGHFFNDSDGSVDTYQNAGAAGNIQIQNVENLEGGAGDDTLIGNISSNTLLGGSGNDLLIGKENNNELDGQSGIDTADYSDITSGVGIRANMNSGVDGVQELGEVVYNATSLDTLKDIENIKASKNNDEIIGDSDDNINNLFEGMGGDDTISGGSGDDTIYGNNQLDSLKDTADGADTLSGGSGDDTLYGQTGDDTLIGNSGADTLDGGVGSDTADYSYLDVTSDSVTVDFTANSGNGEARIGSETDSFNSVENAIGTINNDTFIMSEGTTANSVDGKTGVDTIDYSNYTTKVEVDLSNTSAQTVAISDNDTILNIENITATILDDTITGSNSDNSLDGNEGSDLFYSSTGDDIINGGIDADGTADVDIANYSNATEKIILTNGNSVQKNITDVDTLQNIEEVQGSNFDDDMTGGSSTDILRGGNGNDELKGAAGVDSLYGESGNDTLSGGLGNDILDGGTNTAIGDTVDYLSRTDAVQVDLSNNQAIVDTDSDSTFENDGSDEIDAITNIENITATAQNDELTGSSTANEIKAGAGNDTIKGGLGADKLYGEDGDDIFTFDSTINDSTGDFIDGGANNSGANTGDTVNYSALTSRVKVDLDDTSAVYTEVGSDDENHQIQNIENITGTNLNDVISGNTQNNTLRGLDGVDTLSGEAGDDYLEGGDGNDTLRGGAGDDNLVGGQGTDIADYKDATEDLNVDISDNPKFISASQGTDTFNSIEGVIGGLGDDTLTGNNVENTLIGNLGDDTLIGAGTSANGQIDYLDGGAGVDFVSFSTNTTGITVDLSNLNAQDTDGTLGVDLIIKDIENAEGGSGDDQITGNSDKNTLNGLDGDDTFIASLDDDTIDGGNNTAIGDTVDYSSLSSGVTVNAQGGGVYRVTKSNGVDTLTNIENINASDQNDTLYGDETSNTFYGAAGDDYLDGKGGNDFLYGEADDDTLLGGTGNDLLDGGTGNDTADYSDATSTGVTVNLNTSTAQTVSAELGDDTLVSIENLKGSSFADSLIGDSNANIINAGAGDDEITGNGGADTLNGESGDDLFLGSDFTGDVINGGTNSSVGDRIDYTALGTSTIDVRLLDSGFSDVKVDSVNNHTISDIENITGALGNDTIEGNSANNSLDGNDGTDTISYENATSAVTVNLGGTLTTPDLNLDSVNEATIAANSATGATIGTDNLTNFENIVGSDNADTLIGDANSNSIDGGRGNDLLLGGAGSDFFEGGDGENTVSYALETDVNAKLSRGVTTGTGIVGTSTDTFSNIQNIIGSTGNDTIEGNDGNNTLIGGAGIDTLSYANATSSDSSGVTVSLSDSTSAYTINTLNDGDDVISGFENIIGSSTNDILTGNSSSNTINGANGNDTLSGGAGVDELNGQIGNDVFAIKDADVDGSNDVLNGGANTDTLDYSALNSIYHVNVDLSVPTAQVLEGLTLRDSDTISGIENVIGSSSADTITGDGGINVIDGQDENDTIDGGAGADILNGDDGDDRFIQRDSETLNDAINGGTNSSVGDTVDYSNLTSSVTVDLLNGGSTTTVQVATVNDHTIRNIENITGSSVNDTITGNNSINTILGGAGDDTIDGGLGADYLDGEASTAIGNKLTYSSITQSVRVDLNTNSAITDLDADGFSFDGSGNNTDANDEQDTILNFKTVEGSTNDDILIAGASGNTLQGNAGDDTLVSGAGDDYLDGGIGQNLFTLGLNNADNGSDTVVGGSDIDTADYSAITNASRAISVDLADSSPRTVTISGVTSTDSLQNVENVIGGAGNDNITGDSQANRLEGRDGNDRLDGEDAKDTLYGGDGVDDLYGGDAEDTLYGDAGNDNLYGQDDADSLFGGAGDDTLSGGAGIDYLDGGTQTTLGDSVNFSAESGKT